MPPTLDRQVLLHESKAVNSWHLVVKVPLRPHPLQEIGQNNRVDYPHGPPMVTVLSKLSQIDCIDVSLITGFLPLEAYQGKLAQAHHVNEMESGTFHTPRSWMHPSGRSGSTIRRIPGSLWVHL